MDSSHLTKDQRRRLAVAVADRLGWLYRLRRRMELLGFEPRDPLYLRVCEAEKAIHTLRVHTHYLAGGTVPLS